MPKLDRFGSALFVGLQLVVLGALGAACTVTATTTPPPTSNSPCSQDPSVSTCVTGAVGYSCGTGVQPPDQADPSLVCSVPTTQGNVDLYCCYTNTTMASGSTCRQDQTITGCMPDSAGNPSYGFSCTGSDTPAMDYSGIMCSAGTPGSGATVYCCSYGTPVTTSNCSQSSSVSCAAGTTGWTCTGSAQPQDSNSGLVCSTDGSGNYCCSTSTCNYDSSINNCVTGAVGYSCATGAPPPDQADPTLVCSVPATQNNVDLYCCYTNATMASGSTCSQDPTITGCMPDSAGNPSYGFSCTGSDTPDMDYSGITCSPGTPGNGATLYCCSTGTPVTTNACSQSSTVSCVTGTTGWTCTGTAQPEDSNTGLVCSTDGSGNYCCSTSTCNYDSTITTCVTGAVGYSCATGAAPPAQADPTLVCSVPTTQNNVDQYCCYTNTTTPPAGSTCSQDPTITGCMPDPAGNPSYGFSCTGTDTPDMDYSGLTCSAGTPGTGNTLYCCTYQ